VDVSGSMFNQDVQNVLFSSCKLLEAQGKLRASYMFDTDVMRMDLDRSKVCGGGGTAITQEMIAKIKAENPGKIEFVLLSDMQIMWSETVRKNETFHLVEWA
jgi:hypothetical protein